MEKVKRLVKAGASITGAIKEALGMTVSAFAAKYDLPRTATSEAINGQRRATDALVAALISEIGGTTEDWRALLEQAREAAAAAAAA